MDRIDTRATRLFGVRYPVVQGGMIWVSGWRLAAAVSEAGGLGLIGAGSMTPELLGAHVDKLRAATDAPFGVNVPGTSPHAEAHVAVCLERKVPIVFTSAGSPRRFVRQLKDAGVVVAHVAPSAALAVKVERAGCDAVVAEGTEAGGHNGFEEIATFTLVPSVAEAVRIPVIAAGGIADGRGLAAALALGADGVQVGSRFALTAESSASDAYKLAVISSAEGEARLHLRSVMPTRALANAYVRRVMDAERRGAGDEELRALHGKGRARLGIFDGDLDEGELEIGQVASRLRDLPPAAEVVRRIVEEYASVVAALPGLT
jgi:enoyl-[acyl-carrier protein] reductase II